jgi:DNA-binding transcriptional LysR family regulator
VVHEVPVGGPVSVNLGDAFGSWVLDGLGIGLAALWHAGPDLQAGRLVRVLPGYCVFPETRIWVVRAPGRLMSARVKAFLDFMQTRIQKTNAARYGALLTNDNS